MSGYPKKQHRVSATERRYALCAYCRATRAVNRDHVVPKSIAKRYDLPEELKTTVPSCYPCNIRKGARKLVPPSWEEHIPALKELIPGPWRVWDGNPMSPIFRDVHV